jgi:hypothetical protein
MIRQLMIMKCALVLINESNLSISRLGNETSAWLLRFRSRHTVIISAPLTSAQEKKRRYITGITLRVD